MKLICKFLIHALRSKISVFVLVVYCAVSFYVGQVYANMSIFSASGGIMTACGLLSLIRFTTIEKYIHQDATIYHRTESKGPVLTREEDREKNARHISATHVRIISELHAELIGITMIVIGTFISSYGSYIPVF